MLLQRAGYETAFIGKWHMGNDDSRRPGFDTWVSFKGQGQYLDPEIAEGDRTAAPVRGYITDILNSRALEFVRRPRTKPFLLYLSHKAVHPNIRQLDDGALVPIDGEMFVPAERHRQLLVGATVPRRPNFGKPPLDKPALMRTIGDLPPLGPGHRHRRRDRARTPARARGGGRRRRRYPQGARGARSARQYRRDLCRRQRLFLWRARPERRAAPGLRRIGAHPDRRAVSEAHPGWEHTDAAGAQSGRRAHGARAGRRALDPPAWKADRWFRFSRSRPCRGETRS